MLLLAQNIRELEHFGRAAFKDETHVHAVGIALLVLAVLATLSVPRRYSLIPMFIIMALVPSAQRLAIMSLDFPFLRILVLVLIFRIAGRGEAANFVWKPLDALMVWWIGATFITGFLRTGGEMLVYHSGMAVDALGGYFAVRCLIRDSRDFNVLVRAASIVAIPVAIAFLVENSTQRNLFAIFGGVSEITAVRDDRLRCQGPYNHPILAGCFWAALLPVMAARWWQGGSARREALLASVAAVLIVYCCASSTPVFGLLGGLIGAAFFPLRRNLRLVRWALVLSIVALHIVMKAPVWHLISRVSAVGGSTAYFRYQLIDHFIRRVNEWVLIGTNSTAHWFWGSQDLTNFYVAQGVAGGLVTLALFIAIIAVAFAGMGRAWRQFEASRPTLILCWALGVTLFVHAFNFFGVSYFGTITALWYLTLGAIGSISPRAKSAAARSRRALPPRLAARNS